MMKRLTLLLLPLLLLCGCATDYGKYAQAIEAQAKYSALADTARSEAFMQALKSVDPVVAAVAANGLSISEALRASGRGSGGGNQTIAAPKSGAEEFAMILGAVTPIAAAGLNFAGQLSANRTNRDIQIHQADANVELARVNGETTRYQWGAVRDMNHDSVAAISNTATAGFFSVGEITATLGKPNINTYNVGGDFAGRDQNKPITNTYNVGGDYTGRDKPTVTCTTAPTNNTGTTTPTANGGAITCPQDTQK
jgi:hypothetical protein